MHGHGKGATVTAPRLGVIHAQRGAHAEHLRSTAGERARGAGVTDKPVERHAVAAVIHQGDGSVGRQGDGVDGGSGAADGELRRCTAATLSQQDHAAGLAAPAAGAYGNGAPCAGDKRAEGQAAGTGNGLRLHCWSREETGCRQHCDGEQPARQQAQERDLIEPLQTKNEKTVHASSRRSRRLDVSCRRRSLHKSPYRCLQLGLKG